MDSSLSPSRRGGAASETPTPQDISWDDLKLMIDGENVRPFAWSVHNLLFLSDPMSPAIHAKHLPPAPSKSRTSDVSSQNQSYPLRFTLPPPTPIAEMPLSYTSATILTLSPQSKFLYAYFPPTQPHSSTGGLACVWETEGSVDTWVVRDFWHFSPEAGVVAMRWLGEEREWYPHSGVPLRASRYPHLGPKLLSGHPAFIAITQDHSVYLYFRPELSRTPGVQRFFSSLSVSVLSPTAAVQGQSEPTQSHSSSLGGKRTCLKAAIGLGYNDWSIIVATRSSVAPSQAVESDLSIPSDMADLLPNESGREAQPASWLRSGMWGEEDLIEVCEIEMDIVSEEPCVVTTPLRPISTPHGVDLYLTHLFVTSHPLDSSAHPPPGDKVNISCSFQVVASFLDQNLNSGLPGSTMMSWRLSKSTPPPSITRNNSGSPSRNKPATPAPLPDWSCRQSAQRTVESGVISAAQLWDSAGNILLCKLDISPIPSETQDDCLRIGEMTIISSINLENNQTFEPEPILRRHNKPSREFPMFVYASPHRTLLCTTSGTIHSPTVSVFPAPRWKASIGNQSGPLRMISSAIAIQLRHPSGSDMSDVVRAIWEVVPTSTMAEATAALQTIFKETFALLDSPLEFDVHQAWLPDFVGMLLIVYRWAPFNEMRKRWKTASELCQLYASVRALDDSRSVSESNGYDFTPLGIWELIQQASWLIGRCENLLRTLVEWEGRRFSDETPSELILAVHPFPLELFLRALVHLNRLKAAAAALKKTENNQMAVFSLNNLMDEAGLDFVMFANALQSAKDLVRNSDIPNFKEHCRYSLLSLKTSEALFPLLRRVANEYTQPQVLHRVRLFIPPDDLLVSRTIGSSTSSGLPNPEIDIIRKTKIPRGTAVNPDADLKTCVSCGGRTSSTPSTEMGNGWRVFESIWQGHCVCGGVWAKHTGGDLLGARS